MSPWSVRWSFVDLLAAALALADADVDAAALRLLLGHTDARRVATDRADDHYVRDRNRRGLVHDPAGDDLGATHPRGVANRPRLRMPLGDVQILDQHAALGRARLDDPAALA